MRPDRIVVGEVRGPEAFELTRASNAGCGFCCTIHANGARQALDALVASALMAGENVTEPVVRKVFASTIDLVIHVDRETGGGDGRIRRGVREVLAVAPTLTDGFTTQPIFAKTPGESRLEWTGALPGEELAARIERECSVSLRDVCGGGP
jgi:Flp pilus assembly CpaF family ATPase